MNNTTRRSFSAGSLRFCSAICYMLALTTTFLTPAALAVQSGISPPTAIALSGMSAPGGGTYNSFESNPVINSSGQVAFIANMTSGVSNRGLFTGTTGSLQQLARTGDPTPGIGNYSFIISCLINDSGQVAFNTNISGGGTTGLFVGTPGSVQKIAQAGDAAPSGGNYGSINLGFSYSFNGNGKVVYPANLTGGSSTQGIFTGYPGSLQTVALQGTTAPAGGTYSGFGTAATKSVINNSGQVAFLANLTGSSLTQGIFTGLPGSIQAVALQGTAAPAGGNFSTLTNPVINGSGMVAFFSQLTGGASTRGLFVGTPGSLQTVASQGVAAPAGGNYSSFGSVVLNGSGQVAFQANLVGGSSQTGVFVGTPGTVQAVALGGTAAPDGGDYADNILGSPVINAASQVAFKTRLQGPGVIPGLTDDAIFAGVPGSMYKVVREGDVIDVDPGIGINLRTVADAGIFLLNNDGSGGQDGKGMSLNDSGQLVYKLVFTDNTSGIFTSQLIAVPEPSTYVLGVMCLIGLIFVARKKQPRAT